MKIKMIIGGIIGGLLGIILIGNMKFIDLTVLNEKKKAVKVTSEFIYECKLANGIYSNIISEKEIKLYCFDSKNSSIDVFCKLNEERIIESSSSGLKACTRILK